MLHRWTFLSLSDSDASQVLGTGQGPALTERMDEFEESLESPLEPRMDATWGLREAGVSEARWDSSV